MFLAARALNEKRPWRVVQDLLARREQQARRARRAWHQRVGLEHREHHAARGFRYARLCSVWVGGDGVRGPWVARGGDELQEPLVAAAVGEAEECARDLERYWWRGRGEGLRVREVQRGEQNMGRGFEFGLALRLAFGL